MTRRQQKMSEESYDALLPLARRAKDHFKWFEHPVAVDDITDFLCEDVALVEMAKSLGFEWTPALVKELCEVMPSTWLMDRIGGAFGVSGETIRNLLHRKK
jgi:hypothetical protein